MEAILARSIELWPVGRPVPYARNARTHSPEQVAQIARSIETFGFTNPVLVDRDGGVIAGHGRLAAAKRLGLAEVPVVRLDHLSEEQKRAYILADNRIALSAGWDDGLLAEELAALEQAGFDLALTGFEQREIDELLAGLAEADEPEADAVPEPPVQPVSRPGDLWQLGPHRVLCGDATDPAAYAALLGGGLADMVFSDPPYNVAYQGSVSDRRGGRARPILNDDLGQGFGAFLEAACRQMLAVTKGAVYLCMSSAELHTLHRAFLAAGGHWSTWIVWAKHAFVLGRSDYQRQHEPILYGWRAGTQHYWCGARDEADVWFVDRPRVNDLHPTMKPVALVERAIRNSSKSRDTVLDPFGGSGSTLIAAETTGRQAALIELDPRHVDVIVRRWQDFAGGSAIHAASGAGFAALAAERVPCS